ncbi:MAG TPA: hypothetical protein DCG25_00200 [Acidimicrobiaceae bacterium]|nr:hypothetical protein [Acidimicrobiaceae bacterium]
MYRIGAELAAGLFDESTGERKTKGMDSITKPLVEKAIVRELGRQLGQGLTSGIGTVSPEQRASLEATVDGILATASSRTGRGLREDVSPELREMIRKDVVGALVDGLEGELGDSLEQTVERVVTKASDSLVRGFQEPDLRIAISESLRDAVYMAVREGRPGSPAVGETLQATLDENVLDPFEDSVSGIADRVASQVDKSAEKTENILKTVISALIVILGVIAVMYMITRRQLQRARATSSKAEQGLRSVDAAVQMLDDNARKNLIQSMKKFQRVAGQDTATAPAPKDTRSDDYRRDDS